MGCEDAVTTVIRGPRDDGAVDRQATLHRCSAGGQPRLSRGRYDSSWQVQAVYKPRAL